MVKVRKACYGKWMLEGQRKDTILRLLDVHKYLTIHDVGEATGASEATIRRDFISLEKENRVRRVRGGVQLVEDGARGEQVPFEGAFQKRSTLNREKKRRIARMACSLLEEGETVIIDGGTTTFQMAECLTSIVLRVVTNSFAIAKHLVAHSRCTVILPEGMVNQEAQLIQNNLTPDPFANYSASKVIMGTEGITDTVLTNNESLVIQAERAMIQHAQQLIVLADESKFGKPGALTLAPIDQVSTVITTVENTSPILPMLRNKGIEVIQT